MVDTQRAAAAAAGLAPTPEEMKAKDGWVQRHWVEAAEKTARPGLTVLANNDAVSLNSRSGGPMTLGGKEYRRGLFVHAVSKVLVTLPAPGKQFTALVGLDTNNQTSGGRGSVVFSVVAGGKAAFKSGVLKEGMAPVEVAADLGGATSFFLEVGDAGDGISCDQSDWVDAKVTLEGGKEVWIGDMKLLSSLADAGGPPFSFLYDGQPSATLLADWPRKHEQEAIDAKRTRHTVTWTDPKTGLAVRLAGVEYSDFATVEWTVYFRNGGTKDTPILSDIQAADVHLVRDGKGEFVLNHNAGSQASPDDYRPLRTPLHAGSTMRLGSSGGRGSDGVWPYFNVDWGSGGAILAVGWPGQWNGSFARDADAGLRFRAGQEQTHFKLLPGEEVRGPLMVVQLYRGDRLRGQNLWRRWMVAHNVPRLNGELPPPLMPAGSSNQCNEMQNANEANQKQFIDGYLDNGVKIDFWWMDAGWYINGTNWPNVGTWEVDLKRFPGGLRAVTDHAHAKGVRALVWFEPERVTPGTWLYDKHPEWLLGKGDGQKLLDLGNDEARKWLVDHIDKTMTEQGIDIYRQDFNMAPLGYWRANDAPDRQGITEIKHVTGYLAFWDELRRRHPGLLIDTCASGGRRNDLETLRRSVPLHKSDMEYPNLTSKQTQLYGLAAWSPYFGAPVYPADRVDVYGFRSGMAPMTGLGYDTRKKDYDFALMRKLVAEWKQVSPNYYGDFYPLTGWSVEPDVWMAWQFDRPEAGQGVVQAFRRPQSCYETARFKLRGLDPVATYDLKDFDKEGTTKVAGKDLMEKGLLMEIGKAPSAVTILYNVVK
jgi:alpha-galactosidase